VQRRRPAYLSQWTAVVALALSLGGGCSNDGSSANANAAAGRPRAPDFELEALNGGLIRLSDLQGKVVLIDFWATWCGPCRMQIPHLKQLYADWNGRGLEILGLSVDEREDVVRAFINNTGIEYPTCMSTAEVVRNFGSFQSIPTAFLIDRQGNIAMQYTGLQSKHTLESAIEQLLDDEV